MARLPSADQIRQRQIRPGPVTSPDIAAAGAIGRGLEQLGQGVAGGGRAYAQGARAAEAEAERAQLRQEREADKLQRLQAEDDIAAAQEAERQWFSSTRGALYNPESGYLTTTQGRSAYDGYGATIKAIDDSREAAAKDLSPGARERFMASSERGYQSFSLSASQHAARERHAWRKSQIEGQIAKASIEAGDAGYTPEALDEALYLVDASSASLGELEGKSAEEVTAARRMRRSETIYGAVISTAASDPVRAHELLERYGDGMAPTQRAKAQAFVRDQAYVSYRDDMLKDALGAGGQDRDGVPGVFWGWLDQAEAGPAGYSAQNPTSSASGRGQMVGATWADYQASNPAAAEFETMADAPPEVQDHAIAWLYKRESSGLQAAGLDPTPGNVAVAWRYGVRGAETLLRASPSTPIEQALAQAGYGEPETVARNNGVAGQTVGQVLASFEDLNRRGSLAGDPRYALMTPEQRTELQAQQQKAAAYEAKAERDALYDALDLRAARGLLTDQEIEAARTQSGMPLSDGDKATLTRRVGERKRKSSDAAFVQGMIEAGAPLNGYLSEHRSAADAYAELLTEAATASAEAKGESAPPPLDIAAYVAVETGVAPDVLVADVRQAMVSGDPERAAAALGMAAAVMREKPQAFYGRGGAASIHTAADRYTAALELGYPVGVAIDYALREDDGAKEAARAAGRQFDGRETNANPETSMADIVQEFDAYWLDAPELRDQRTPQMRGDAMRIFEIEYRRSGGNGDLAAEATKRQLARVWGVSEVSGSPELMRYPPEAVYPADKDGGHEYIQKQIVADLKDERIAPGYDDGEWFLMSTDDTLRAITAGEPAVYLLLYEDENGVIQVAQGPDGGPAGFYADAEGVAVDEIAEARRAETGVRERYREFMEGRGQAEADLAARVEATRRWSEAGGLNGD